MKKDWITSGSAQICEIVIRSRDPNQGPHSPGERDAIDGRQLAPNPWRLVSSEDNERQRQLFFWQREKSHIVQNCFIYSFVWKIGARL